MKQAIYGFLSVMMLSGVVVANDFDQSSAKNHCQTGAGEATAQINQGSDSKAQEGDKDLHTAKK
jgi:hypothetical protein